MKENTSLNDLPPVIVKYMGQSFFDIKTILIFSSINKKYKTIFSDLREIYLLLVKSKFYQKFRSTVPLKLDKNEFYEKILIKKEFDKLGSSIMLFSCGKNDFDFEIVKYFIDNKCDLNSRDSYGNTPFLQACQYRESIELLRYLVEKGSDIKAKNKLNKSSLQLPLSTFMWKLNLEKIKYLVEIKGDLNQIDEDNNTPLSLMCSYSDITEEMIQLFIENDGIFNEKPFKNLLNNTKFYINKELYTYFLEIGCKNNDLVPFLKKPKRVDLEMVKFLLESKCQVQNSVTDILVNEENLVSSDIFEYLFQLTPIEELTKNSIFLFRFFKNAYNKYPFEIALSLIKNKCDINSHVAKDSSPFTAFICQKDVKIEHLQLLINCKADLKGSDYDPVMNTNLHILCYSENINYGVLKCLIKKSASVNKKNNFDQTPVHYACMNKKSTYEIIKLFVQNGSSLNKEDYKYNTPLWYAEQNYKLNQDLERIRELSNCQIF